MHNSIDSVIPFDKAHLRSVSEALAGVSRLAETRQMKYTSTYIHSATSTNIFFENCVGRGRQLANYIDETIYPEFKCDTTVSVMGMLEIGYEYMRPVRT